MMLLGDGRVVFPLEVRVWALGKKYLCEPRCKKGRNISPPRAFVVGTHGMDYLEVQDTYGPITSARGCKYQLQVSYNHPEPPNGEETSGTRTYQIG